MFILKLNSLLSISDVATEKYYNCNCKYLKKTTAEVLKGIIQIILNTLVQGKS